MNKLYCCFLRHQSNTKDFAILEDLRNQVDDLISKSKRTYNS